MHRGPARQELFWQQANANRNAAAARLRHDREVTYHRLTARRPLILGQDFSRIEISTEVIAGLGCLAILPNELIMMILSHCTMRTLLSLMRVNRGIREFVNLLPDFHSVKCAIKLQLERASPAYQQLLATILKITTYAGLRYLTTTRICEKCNGPLAKFQVTRLKVLCDGCFTQR
ncbi:hypothetical protein HD806DRAFT_364219 [Xylariaceae sp. AK1471]|nr:hypothetical protein HD806DRAFT_364219 [Xylariaceae sp. AK1471]